MTNKIIQDPGQSQTNDLDGPPRSALFTGIVVLALIVGLTVLSLSQIMPPPAADKSSLLTEFSAGRAFPHIEAIAHQSRPIGSPELDKAQQYIFQELTRLNLNPEVQEALSSNQRELQSLLTGNIYLAAGKVRNVLARMKGLDNTGAILLVAHSDSVPNGPGASDNGVSIAALLETARALGVSAPLKNDVIFLFTDGEEVGSLGAHAFINEHPWAKDVQLALNFEARGTSGPSLVFETSRGNSWLIREFAQATSNPVANSLFYEIYKVLPNDSDFTVFREAGIQGMNFAFIDGYPYYHSAADSIEHVDVRSLQHQGMYALELARDFGNLDLRARESDDDVFFNVIGSQMIFYPYQFIYPLSGLVLLLFIGVIVLGLKQGRLSFKGLLFGLFIFLFALIAAVLLITLLWWGITSIHHEYTSIRQGDIYNRNVYILGFVFCIIAVILTLYSWIHKRTHVANLALGCLAWWVILAIIVTIYLPGASYLFIWPATFSLTAFWVVFLFKQQDFQSPWVVLALSIGSLPGLFLLVPIIYLLFVGLGISMANGIIVIVMLVLGLFIPYLVFIVQKDKKLSPIITAAIGVGFLLAGSLTAKFDRYHPKQDSLIYGLVADQEKALWASTDHQPDEWTAQFFGDSFEEGHLPDFFPIVGTVFIQSPAPLALLAAPEVTLLDNTITNDIRNVRLHVISPRIAPAINFYFNAETHIIGALIDGQRVYRNDGPVSHTRQLGLRYWTLPPEGIELTLEIPATDPLKITVVDQSPGLPDIPGVSYTARPDYIITSPFGFEGNEFTRVSRIFNIINQP